MSQPRVNADHDSAQIVLGLLESVEKDGAQSQRRLATELGIALGLVNAYIKRCVKKGLLKVRQAPAGRYAYYLTPQGFSEKSRLTLEFLSSSLSFFRMARGDCTQVFEDLRARGFRRVVLCGRSDLTEIATLCAIENDVVLVAVVDPKAVGDQFLNIPLRATFDQIEGSFDAVVVTDLAAGSVAAATAIGIAGADRVFAPKLLGLQLQTARRS